MKITINSTTKNTEITDAIRNKVNEKLSKLNKFISEDEDVRVVVRVVKNDQIVEITLPNHHGKIVRVEERAFSLYDAIDKSEKMLSRKLRKLKEKNIDTKRVAKKPVDSFETGMNPPEYDMELKRHKQICLKDEMTDEEAIEQMIALGHTFFLYKNKENRTAVIYTRKDGTFGSIEIVD